jgi:hypothetical protein
VDDIAHLSVAPEAAARWWSPLPKDEWAAIERRVRGAFRVRDDFVTIPFPRIVSTDDRQIALAVESYRKEAAIIDPRLSHEVDLAEKATALSDLCDALRRETGIHLTARSSVADERVTIFCRSMPLREGAPPRSGGPRQLSRPFGYSWARTRREKEYRYELEQDLRSQLLEAGRRFRRPLRGTARRL